MTEGHQVFISFKNTDGQGKPTIDSKHAARIHKRLVAEGLTVFFSNVTLEEQGASEYRHKIFQALDTATVLIVVGSSAENLSSRWVQEEWDTFLNEIVEGRKPAGALFVYADGPGPAELPVQLRKRQVFSHGPTATDSLVRYVVNALGGDPAPQTPTPAPQPPLWRRPAVVTAAALLVCVLLAGWYFFQRPSSSRDFRVNTTVSGQQLYPSLAAADNGNFLVAWGSDHSSAAGYDVYARVFGNTLEDGGPEILINQYTPGDQAMPVVAGYGKGQYAVLWNSEGQDGDGWGIYGQLLQTDGTLEGSEFLVNTNWQKGHQQLTAAATLDKRGFIVVWHGTGELCPDTVFAQRFAATGRRVGPVLQPGSPQCNRRRFPAVSPLPGGGFCIVWEEESVHEREPFGIFARFFDAQSTPVTEPFVVNTHVRNRQRYPAVASSADQVLVTWTSEEQDGSGRGVYGQFLRPSGERVGEEFRVNANTTGHQWLARVTTTPSGFVVAWIDQGQEGAGSSVMTSMFAGDGTRIGTERMLNFDVAGDHTVRGLIPLGGGGVALVWEGAGVQGDRRDVFARILDTTNFN